MSKPSAAICIALLLLLSMPLSSWQKNGTETPVKIEVARHPLELEPPIGPQAPKLDPAKLRQQADELSSLAQSIPVDIAQLSPGKLPKDIAGKLKPIEKLSKNLRNELTP
jgi:hypothetical protein